MAGISSTITSGMAAGSIFAGIFGGSYYIKDRHSPGGLPRGRVLGSPGKIEGGTKKKKLGFVYFG